MTPTGKWWKKNGDRVICLLCPHSCSLQIGSIGFCQVRQASRDGIKLPSWGRITAKNLDPIEKKPLYHFYPGKEVWSVGFAGCNMACPFCQNHRISRTPIGQGPIFSPEGLAISLKEAHATIGAFTYSEPTIHAEYLLEAAQLIQAQGMSTVLVTNGMINPEPAAHILSLMDAVNIDLKSWNDAYYKKTLKGYLETVKEFIQIARECSWVELTTLIVTGDNDSEDEMRGICDWIARLSPDIPLHLSAYHPAYTYSNPPTSRQSLVKLANVAREYLNFVYMGNLGNQDDTLCPRCGTTVIRRNGHRVGCSLLEGKCPNCTRSIPGVFDNA